jgi:recombination protein RecT
MSTEDAALVKPQTNDPVRALSKYLDARAKNLAKFAASRIKPETLIRLAIFEFSQNEWLRRCTPESIYGSLILSAQIGLEPSGIKGEAYLVPFKGQCQLIPGWRGLVKLALRSRAVRRLNSFVVYERDDFKIYLGSDPRVEHQPCLDSDRGELIGAYAVAKMDNGEIDVEWMDVGELQKIKDNAAKARGGKAGPAYAEWEDQMFRKAPIRRLAKRLPLGDDFFMAMKADELAETGEQDKMNGIIDAEFTETTAEKSQATTDAIGSKLAEKAAQVRGEAST